MKAVSDRPGNEADLSAWIGRKSERLDVIDERLIAGFTATFSPYLGSGAKVPPGIFWCLAPDIVSSDLLGGDGHPRLGIFLPDPGLPRRHPRRCQTIGW
jgi:3-methylfumaryl-CoA hydratase